MISEIKAKAHFREHIETAERSSDSLAKQLCVVSSLIADSLKKGGTLFLCGNGGSASDSQHISAELVGRFLFERDPLRAIALTTDTSALTCIANDYSYHEVFSRQLKALARERDILLTLSTSGNSNNVVNAAKVAKDLNLITIGFLGHNGGTLASIVDHSLIVDSTSTARIQEIHILMGHILCDLIESAFTHM